MLHVEDMNGTLSVWRRAQSYSAEDLACGGVRWMSTRFFSGQTPGGAKAVNDTITSDYAAWYAPCER
jgi:hypothetical protein